MSKVWVTAMARTLAIMRRWGGNHTTPCLTGKVAMLPGWSFSPGGGGGLKAGSSKGYLSIDFVVLLALFHFVIATTVAAGGRFRAWPRPASRPVPGLTSSLPLATYPPPCGQKKGTRRSSLGSRIRRSFDYASGKRVRGETVLLAPYARLAASWASRSCSCCPSDRSPARCTSSCR